MQRCRIENMQPRTDTQLSNFICVSHHTHSPTHTHSDTYTSACTHTHTRTHTRTHTHTHTRTHTHTHIHTHANTHMMCMNACIYQLSVLYEFILYSWKIFGGNVFWNFQNYISSILCLIFKNSFSKHH